MKYDDALKAWGASNLRSVYSTHKFVEINDVEVTLDFNEGYACCGGNNPGCYCSFAESPSAKVLITGSGVTESGEKFSYLVYEISAESFDFAEILLEICEAAGGSVTTDNNETDN